MQDELRKMIFAPVALTKLLDSLDFTDEQVVDAAKEQAKLFLDASRFRIQKMHSRIEAESALSVLKSKLSLQIRERLAQDSSGRVTEGLVSATLEKNPKMVRRQKELAYAEEEEEFSKLMLEAFRLRRDALKVVAEVVGAEVYMSKLGAAQLVERKQMSEVKDKLKKKYPGGSQ